MSGKVTETSPDKEKRSPWPRYDAAVLGFRNYWYPALASRRVRRKPVSLKVLGERMVFIRYQGSCYALEDRCAHRGVPLSVGRCEFRVRRRSVVVITVGHTTSPTAFVSGR